MRVVHRQDRARSSTGRYELRCPAGCTSASAQDQAEAARLINGHPAVCPSPGPAMQPVRGGPTIYPLTYADRIGR